MQDRNAALRERREIARRRAAERPGTTERLTVRADEVREGDWIERIHPYANVRGVRFGDGARVTLAIPAEEATERLGLYGRYLAGAIAIQAAGGTVYAIRPGNPVELRRRVVRCDECGEEIAPGDERGEFARDGETVHAHVGCAAGLPIA